MLTSPSTRPASTDLSFFSKSKHSNAVASSSTSVVVTTRLARRPPPKTHLQPRLPPPPAPPPKRKHATNDVALPRDVKRLRVTPEERPKKKRVSSKSSSRSSSHRLTPEPIYRSSVSRSRSASVFPLGAGQTPTPRTWPTDIDGTPGPDFLSSEMVVRRLLKSYKRYFLDIPEDTVVELEFPNSNATEKFLLLEPKDKDHYNPIYDLEKSLYTIIKCYLTPEQQSSFGPIPNCILPESSPPPSPSPTPSPPASRGSSLSSSNSSPLSSPPSSPARDAEEPRLALRTLQRAIHIKDGHLFKLALSKINNLLRRLKYPPLPADPFTPPPTNSIQNPIGPGLPKEILLRILEENYQRSVGPNVQSLKRYEAFSSETYGELMPSLSHEIIAFTGLTQDSLFLDLGSGVGNVVVQASLQTGCKSFGIEKLPEPAKIARNMLEQFKIRCRMWGVDMGEVELEEGDMLHSQRVDELMAKADVVLVDNKVFDQALNEALRPKFLDLKEGAILVSLSPFVSSLNARVTERNIDDISAIFDVTERPYHSGSVSWGSGGGSYYIHRVDREGYAKIRERWENSREGAGGGGGRTTRTRKAGVNGWP